MRLHEIAQRPRPMLTARLREIVPDRLAAISDADLLATLRMMMEGHALDGVIGAAARRPLDAIEDMADALGQLNGHFNGGTVVLYRTIEVPDPQAWVRANLTETVPLGRYWSLSEHWVMGHAEDERVLFCVEAPIAAINWPETIILIVDGVEGEVRLTEGATIQLNYCEPCDWKFTPEKRQIV